MSANVAFPDESSREKIIRLVAKKVTFARFRIILKLEINEGLRISRHHLINQKHTPKTAAKTWTKIP